MIRPMGTKRIDQTLHKRRPSSFEVKDDPVHTRLLDLFWDDLVADMFITARRGIANIVHFILMRGLNDLMVGKCIDPKDVHLMYQYDELKERHRIKITVVHHSKCNHSAVSVRGK
jgi:hypothetical protein